jgi:chitin synthase
MIAPFAAAFPFQAPTSLYTSLEVIRAFTHCVTPFNPSYARYSSLAAEFTLDIEGTLVGTSISLSDSGIDTSQGLLHVPEESGYRAFHVFYYLTAGSSTKAEKDFLDLGPLSSYALLKRSGTFGPPEYVPTADDAAAAEDFRNHLRFIGIKANDLRNLICALAGLLKLGNSVDYFVDGEVVDEVCKASATLLDMEESTLKNKFDTIEREIFIGGVYEAIVDWVIRYANHAMTQELQAARAAANGASGSATPEEVGDTVTITVIDIPDPSLGKAIALRTVFDDTQGINAEMKEDGVQVAPAGASVSNEMKAAVAARGADLGEMDSIAAREREVVRDRREGVLEKAAQLSPATSYMKELLHPVSGQGVVLGSAGRFDVSSKLLSSRAWFQLNLHPTDDFPAALATSNNHWSAAAVSSQLRAWRLPEWANRRNRKLDFTADFDFTEFSFRYAVLGCGEGKEAIETWLVERGWCNGDVVIGHDRIWLRESAWWEAECLKDALPESGMLDATTPGMESGYSAQTPGMGSGFFDTSIPGSRDNLIPGQQSTLSLGFNNLRPHSVAPTGLSASPGDYGLGKKGDTYRDDLAYEGQGDLENPDGKVVERRPVNIVRRLWLGFVWALTFWIPSPLLRYVGRMRRPDVRLAWREKVALVFLIMLMNAAVVFYIIFFGKLLCPNFDKAWSPTEVSYHQGADDFWVSHRGHVYDLSKFWRTQHGDDNRDTTPALMQPYGGTNVDTYINPPLTLACPNLVNDPLMQLTPNVSLSDPTAIHTSGPALQPDTRTALNKIDWYTKVFMPKMNHFLKGDLVYDIKDIRTQGVPGYRNWFIIDNSVYDLTDYFNTVNNVRQGVAEYDFFPKSIESLIEANFGLDISQTFATTGNRTERTDSLRCLNNYFYAGRTDFRKTPKCQVNNWLLLSFTIILCAVIVIKFLAALQLGSKRRPQSQDKFVIMQVPAYTEGEDQLRKGLDSLAATDYDNKRKLICVICDGVIVGKGELRPTPKIVLDILGVDPAIDPPALPFKSVGEGGEQLNYGKVFSGLYEHEGHVVPYIVVVKVGKDSEQGSRKPGNRGKRDSQILLMNFLNRVHHRSSMSPLELEMFHQINNIIGVDPELYEYLLMVDADTMVKEDSVTRLVASCAHDAKIAGICGETSLQNEEGSWWTMIQVYEYYISHHLAKAFESLFGSVTCLPGW